MIYPDEDMRRWESCDSVVLADADNYYTKGQVDEKIDEIIISGGGITEDEVQDMIDASISGKAETSAVTAIDEAYKAADASISGAVDNLSSALQTEAERAQNADSALSGKVDTLSGAVEAISGESITTGEVQTMIDGAVSGKADTATTYTKTETDNAITAATADMATQSFVSGYTYDKQTIEDMIEEGGGFIPENYYDKTATDALLGEKLDVTAYTPTDLSNYYQKSETSGATEISNALNGKLDTTAYTPTDLSNYYQKSETSGSSQISTALNGKVDNSTFNTYTASTDSSLSGKADTSAITQVNDALTAHTANTDIHVTTAQTAAWNAKSDFSGSYNDLTDKPTIPSYTAGSGITITNNAISVKMWQGTKAQYNALATKDSTTIYLIYEE